MGKLTPQMIEAIIKKYGEVKSYSKTALDLGLNWKTVKTHVLAHERACERQTGQSGLGNQSHIAIRGDSNPAVEKAGHASELAHGELENGKEPAYERNSSQQGQHEQYQKKRVKSNFARALHSFEKDLTPVQVAVEIDLPFDEVQKYYAQFGFLRNLHTFYKLCQSDAGKVNSLISLHNSMLEENMSPKQYVNVLKYYNPVREIVQKYHDLKVSTQQQAQEHQQYEQKLKEMQQAVVSFQKQAADLQNKRSFFEKQSSLLESQINGKKTALNELGVRESSVRAQVQSKLLELKQLTSENGPIHTQIKVVAKKKAYEVLNNNELILGTCVAAAISVMMQDPFRFIDFHNQFPMRRGEDSTTYVQRCIPFFKEKFELMFNQVKADFARAVSNFTSRPN